MTDNHAPFLAAIAAHPGAAAPRLIYADWLEEQGDMARAEAWRRYVEEKWQPLTESSYQDNKVVTLFCWERAWQFRNEVSQFAPAVNWIPRQIFEQVRHSYRDLDKDTIIPLSTLRYRTSMDAELAVVEAITDLIRGNVHQPNLPTTAVVSNNGSSSPQKEPT